MMINVNEEAERHLLRAGRGSAAREARAALADRFKALADPTRVAIVQPAGWCRRGLRLRLRERARVVAADDLAPPAHPAKAGLVEASRRGTWAYYRLVPNAIAELARALGRP